MKQRSVVAVVLLSLFTFGIYPIIWLVKTKGEMVTQGADIPTAWLLIVPIANIYWTWKWAGGVDHVTRSKMSQPITFIMVYVLSIIGIAIVQDSLNKAAAAPGFLPRAQAI
jgi:uncharacterized protein DUF4234